MEPACEKVCGLKFIGWEATTAPTEDTYTSSYTTPTENLYNVGSQYTVTDNICFVARYSPADVNLYDDEGNESAYDITSPVFSNVTISTSLHPVATTATEGVVVTFAGAYSPLFIGLENRNLLYLGADNTLYYPNTAITINSCRAHFRLQGIEAGDPVAPSSPVKAFVLNFGGAEATGIKTTDFTDYTDNKCASWYTLDGRRLNSKPTAKGIYIYGNKKIVIK